MDLILLCFCSIIIARCLEKRMRIASVAYAILFIVLSFFSLFSTGFALVDQAMINIFGENLFNAIREGLMEASPIYRSAFGTLFFVSIIIDVITSITALVLIIKGFRKFSKVVNFTKAPLFIKNAFLKLRLLPDVLIDNNSRNQYLVLQQLRI